MGRTARVERATKESKVVVSLDLDGSGRTEIATGVPFFDHMLGQLGKHSLIDLEVQATGDVDVDSHHVVEDVAIVLGQALGQALGDKVAQPAIVAFEIEHELGAGRACVEELLEE